jgi:hypothetical protein
MSGGQAGYWGPQPWVKPARYAILTLFGDLPILPLRQPAGVTLMNVPGSNPDVDTPADLHLLEGPTA